MKRHDFGLFVAVSFCMEPVLQILHLEDDPRDGELVELSLRHAGLHCKFKCSRNEQQFRAAVAEFKPDLILSDFSIPGFDGMTALELARQLLPEVPFIFLSGTIGEERAVSALKRGATDYVLKDRMGRLPSAIHRALSEAREVIRCRRAEEDARTNAERFRHLLAHSPAVLYSKVIDGDTSFPVFVSENVSRLLGFEIPECLQRDWWYNHIHPEDRAAALNLLPSLRAKGQASIEYRLRHKNGSFVWIQDHALLEPQDATGSAKVMGAWTDITERKRVQAELLEASRLAGKAEIATGILHDVRNVLTSITISSSLLQSKAKDLNVSSLQKVAGLLNAQTDLKGFLTEHEKGRKLPCYLTVLAEKLAQEQQAMISELDRLANAVEHVRQLVTAQQGYAKTTGTKERVALKDLIEESLSLNALPPAAGDWAIIKEFASVPVLNIQKHKVLQILVNLVRNAKQACQQDHKSKKEIRIRLVCEAGSIGISVEDNGIGIPTENLGRVFEHGFTTKKDGHGFGLRSAIIAAQELGASLTVESQGLHCGASFTLTFPVSSNPGSHQS